MKKSITIFLFLLSTFLINAQNLIPFQNEEGYYGYRDSNNENVVIKPIYNFANKFVNGYAPVKLNEKWGFLDKTGQEIIPIKYDDLSYFNSSGVAMVAIDKKWGLINKLGNEIIQPQFDNMFFFANDIIAVNNGGDIHYETETCEGGKWGFYNYSGYEITPLKYDGARIFSENLVAVNIGCEINKGSNLHCLGGKWGAIDKTGKEVTELKYDVLYYPSVYLNDKIGFIDTTTGKEILPPVYEKIDLGDSFDFFAVKLDGKWGFVNSINEIIITPQFEDAKGFINGLAAVKLNQKWGYINPSGKVIISFKYDEIKYYDNDGIFLNGSRIVKFNSKWGIIDNTGKEITSYKYDYIKRNSENDDFFHVSINNKRGIVDKKGKEIIPIEYDEILFKEDYILVSIGDKTEILDFKGKQITSSKYDRIEDFHENFAAVEINKKWGFIDKRGKELTPIKYDQVKNFKDEKAEVEIRGIWGTVDKKGKETGIDYNKVVEIYSGNMEGLINLKGDTIASPIYEYIFTDGPFIRGGVDGKMTVINIYSTKQKPLKYDTYRFKVLANGITAKVESNDKIGFVDSLGNEIIPPIYSDFKDYSLDGLIAVAIGDKNSEVLKWGLFDIKGKEILPVNYQNIGDYYDNNNPKQIENDLLPVKINNKSGFVNFSGKAITPFKYDIVRSFSNGLALVGKISDYDHYKYGCINTQGKEVIPIKYNEEIYFRENGLARVVVESERSLDHGFIKFIKKYGFIDRTGKEIIPIIYEDIDYEIKGNLIKVKLNDKYGFIDLKGNDVIAIKYDYVKDFSNGLVVVETDQKYGVIDSTGKLIVPMKYKHITDFDKNGISRVKDSSKIGYIDNSGKEVIPAIYDEIKEMPRNKFEVVQNGLHGVIDRNNKEIISVKYSNSLSLYFNSGNFLPVNIGGRSNGFGDIIGGKWGIIDTIGKTIVPFKYEAIGGIWDTEFIPVKINGKWGYINIEGKIKIPATFDLASNFGDVDEYVRWITSTDVAPVVVSNKYAVINRLGKIISVDFNKLGFTQNLRTVKICNQTGFIDKNGQVVLPFRYGSAVNMFDEDGFAWSSRFGVSEMINTKGEFINFGELEAIKGENDKYGIVDKFGNVLVEAKYDEMTIIVGKDRAIVKSKDKYGIIDKNGKEIVPMIYDDIRENYDSNAIMNNMFQVGLNEKKGYIDSFGKIILPIKYDFIESNYYENDKTIVQVNGKYGFINKEGKEIIPIIYDDIKSFVDGKSQVELNGRTFYIDENGKEVH
ncbi:MAG TPA: WG repeat-containing protein [Flavobacterium sp.]